ncbi:HNH endonuclease signature motif containing protein [Euzebya tangerina]|uniref:HNH endonuclease signature motif containing protein n=1 Tax=Euzebya tangerina TaxID=591198 RepID=UPI000E3177D1|nr:HNH endonuclease signature motif containing protein [Euzebya tangerina]
MQTSERLADQPDVGDAVRSGELSGQQADAVSDAAQADPDATTELLAAASSQSLQDLRRTCRDHKAAADPNPDRTRQRHYQNRSCLTFTESDGQWRAILSGPSDFGARFEAAVRAEHDVQFRIDAEALRRGSVERGETCTIAGVGRVSLSAVKRLIPDAHLAYVIRDATNISVAHLGRQATAHQRTALAARGYECEVPTCRATHLLEIDHIQDWAFSKRTALDQLAWLCTHDHEQKSRGTHHLTGPPGNRTWRLTDGIAVSHGKPTRPTTPTQRRQAPTDRAGPRQPALI